MTLTLGLASVFLSNGSLKSSDEIPVNLPKVQSESPIIVFPKYSQEMPQTSRGRIYPTYEIRKKGNSPK